MACSGILEKEYSNIILDGKDQHNISGCENNTTNNRMELTAPIMAKR